MFFIVEAIVKSQIVLFFNHVVVSVLSNKVEHNINSQNLYVCQLLIWMTSYLIILGIKCTSATNTLSRII